MAGLGNSGADVETIPDEGDAEEVFGGVVGGAKKWSIEEDTRLIRAWINIGTDAVVGSDQKKNSFWKRVASKFNEHRPRGASVRSWKTLNGRWSRCAPLVSKWTGIIEELERSNHSGWNDSMIVEHAQRLFVERIGKKFDFDHWYHLLKDQPKWRGIRNPSTTVGSGSSKRSHSEAEDVDTETVGPTEPTQDGSERPEGRKAAKRRLKEKANSGIIDVVTKQMSAMLSGSGVVQNAFLKFFYQTSEDKSHKKMIREEMLKLEHSRYKLEEDKLKLEEDKLKLEEDKIMMMDTSMMAPEQAAYIQMRRAEILKKRLR